MIDPEKRVGTILLATAAGAAMAVSQVALSSSCSVPNSGRCSACGSCLVVLAGLAGWALWRQHKPKRDGA